MMGRDSVLRFTAGACALLCSELVLPDTSARTALERLEEYGLSGVVLVAHADEILIHEAFGFADREAGIANTTETYFDYASIAKTFTGVAVLIAEQQRSLSTSEELNHYIGPLPGEKNRATIHHLATHRAGLVARGYEGLDPHTRAAFIDSIKAAPIESTPGAEYRYTNAGSSLLAAVLEIAVGRSWSDYVRETLFAAAAMEARFDPELTRAGVTIATGYHGIPPNTVRGLHAGFAWGNRGADGVYGRAIDLFKWVNFILRSNPLPENARSKMLDAQEIEAYGWHVTTTSEGRTLIHKGGDTVLYTSQILYYPENDSTIVWLLNDNRQRWRTALNRLLSRVAWGEPISVPDAVDPEAGDSDPDIVGDHETDDGKGISINSYDGQLVIHAGQLSTPALLFQNGKGKYTGLNGRSGNWFSLRSERLPDGRVSLKLTQ